MYNGHCINPHLSFFYLRQSLRSKYLHMYNYQAALYKARHEQQYRCFESNLPAYSVSLMRFLQLSWNTFTGPPLMRGEEM